VGTCPLRLVRIDPEVGPEYIAGARSWPAVGTRLAVFGVPHSLSLQPCKDTRTPAHVCLPEGHRDGVRHSAGRPHTCPAGRCQGVLGLRLTRLACGKLGISRAPSCARIGEALPEPAGSSPHRTRDGCPQGCSPAPHPLARSASAVPGGAGVAKLEAVGGSTGHLIPGRESWSVMRSSIVCSGVSSPA